MTTETIRRLDTRWKNAKKAWSESELDRLSERLGLIPDDKICRLMGRSPNAIKVASTRLLKQGKKANFYTSRNVSDLLGIGCSKTIIWWMEKGWLKGKKSPVKAGPNVAWCFFEEDIEECLKARPWLCNPAKMQEHFFRTIVENAYRKDPWLTAEEVAPMVGRKTDDAVIRYINYGWLKADKRPGGPWQGVWLVRKSAVEKFLRNDPRRSRSDAVKEGIRRRKEKSLPYIYRRGNLCPVA